jgi:hypothetical protein
MMGENSHVNAVFGVFINYIPWHDPGFIGLLVLPIDLSNIFTKCFDSETRFLRAINGNKLEN